MRHLFSFVIGLGLLLFGILALCRGLRQRGPGLTLPAPRPLGAFGWGAGSALLLQSSSAVTCMLVPLADSGALSPVTLYWTLCGVNLGSSLTGWLFCLPRPSLPIPAFLALWGLVGLWGLARRRPLPLGLACLFLGLELMRGAAAPLGALPQIALLLTRCDHPLTGLWVGILFAGLLQSSGAGMGALLALAGAGSLSRRACFWLVMGLNIGTCSTAALAALPAGKQGRAVPRLHLFINLSAAVLTGLFLLLFPPTGTAAPVEAALFHTAFNSVVPLSTVFFLTILSPSGMLGLRHRGGRNRHDKERLRKDTPC